MKQSPVFIFLFSFLKSFFVIMLFSGAFYAVHAFTAYLSNFTMIPYYLRYWPIYILSAAITLFLYWRVSAAEGASKTLRGEYRFFCIILPHVLSHAAFLLLSFPFREYSVESHAAWILFGVATFPMYATGNVFVGVLIAVAVLFSVKCVAIPYGRSVVLRAHPCLLVEKGNSAANPSRSWRDSVQHDE